MRSLFQYAIWLLPAGWSAVVFLLLTRKVHRYVPGWLPDWADKPVHMLLFGSLSIFTYIAFRKGSSVEMKWAAVSAFVYAALYGAAMEGYQFYIPWRTTDLADISANTLGAASVFLLFLIDYGLVRRRST